MNYTKFTKECFKESKLYLDKKVCKELENLGLYDSSYKNDTCPSFTLELTDSGSPSTYDKYIQIFLANSDNDNIDNEEFNTSIISYIDEKNNLSEYIFESNDIWVIWSVIKSNLDYFKTL